MFAPVEPEGVAEKSVMSFQTNNSQRDRLKQLLSEQIQINEKLEVENEMHKIKLRQAMKLLKSRLSSSQTKTAPSSTSKEPPARRPSTRKTSESSRPSTPSPSTSHSPASVSRSKKTGG